VISVLSLHDCLGRVLRVQGLAATRVSTAREFTCRRHEGTGKGQGTSQVAVRGERLLSFSRPCHRLPGQARIQPYARDTRQTLT